MHRENFYFNGENALAHGIRLQKPISFSGAEPVVETVHVAGRNGDLVFDTGAYSNRKGKAECYCLQTGVEAAVRAAASLLLGVKGYARLECSNDPHHYWMARVVNGPQIEDRMRTLNPFTIEFDCKPQRYIKDGEQAVSVSSGTKLYNTTSFEALPTIFIKGTGAGQIKVGECIVEVESLDDNLILDCDLQNAYYGTTNLNSTISALDFPTLKPGENEVTYTGDWEVSIMPRWWTL